VQGCRIEVVLPRCPGSLDGVPRLDGEADEIAYPWSQPMPTALSSLKWCALQRAWSASSWR